MTEALASTSTTRSRLVRAGEPGLETDTRMSRSLLGNHTYWCALPVRGGVCNCRADHNPSVDPWP